LACSPTPALSICIFPHLHWVLIAPLGVWLFTPLHPMSAFAALPMLVHWAFGSLPHLCSPGQVQHSTPISAVGVRLQFAVYVFQVFFLRGKVFQPAQGLHWIMFSGGG
jgi:hypothetical protein